LVIPEFNQKKYLSTYSSLLAPFTVSQIFYKSSNLSEFSEKTSYALREIGNEDTAKLVKEATNTTPIRASKIRGMWMKKKLH
jgi:hypothetical protein